MQYRLIVPIPINGIVFAAHCRIYVGGATLPNELIARKWEGHKDELSKFFAPIKPKAPKKEGFVNKEE
jgi:hypothetical protein